MHFQKYWAREMVETVGLRGRPFQFGCWKWSDTSLDEAKQKSREVSQMLAERLAKGKN